MLTYALPLERLEASKASALGMQYILELYLKETSQKMLAALILEKCGHRERTGHSSWQKQL